MHPHPLEIAELRMHIGRFLNGKSLKACALVCKAWHRDFQPLVWYSHALRVPQGDTELAAWRSSFAKNARWIRELFTGPGIGGARLDSVADVFSAHCRSLVSLRFTIKANSGQLLSLIEHNQELQQLVCLSSSCPLKRLSLALQGHYQLYDLQLERVWLAGLYRILASCPALRKLALVQLYTTPLNEQDRKEDGEQGFEPLKTFGLCSLNVRYCSDPHALDDLVSRLPFLESFRLGQAFGPLAYVPFLTRLFQQGQLTRLTNLELDNCGPYGELMEAIPPQQLCSVLIGSRDTVGLDLLLERQGPTIQRLHLQRWVHYPTLAKFFFQSPRLKWLEVREPDHGGFLDVLDLLWQPWVCNDLEVLKAPIGVRTVYGDAMPPALVEAMTVEGRKRPLTLSATQVIGVKTLGFSPRQVAENLFVERMQTLHRLRHVDCGNPTPGRLSPETRLRIRLNKTISSF